MKIIIPSINWKLDTKWVLAKYMLLKIMRL